MQQAIRVVEMQIFDWLRGLTQSSWIYQNLD